jgi:hypothetical protein
LASHSCRAHHHHHPVPRLVNRNSPQQGRWLQQQQRSSRTSGWMETMTTRRTGKQQDMTPTISTTKTTTRTCQQRLCHRQLCHETQESQQGYSSRRGGLTQYESVARRALPPSKSAALSYLPSQQHCLRRRARSQTPLAASPRRVGSQEGWEEREGCEAQCRLRLQLLLVLLALPPARASSLCYGLGVIFHRMRSRWRSWRAMPAVRCRWIAIRPKSSGCWTRCAAHGPLRQDSLRSLVPGPPRGTRRCSHTRTADSHTTVPRLINTALTMTTTMTTTIWMKSSRLPQQGRGSRLVIVRRRQDQAQQQPQLALAAGTTSHGQPPHPLRPGPAQPHNGANRFKLVGLQAHHRFRPPRQRLLRRPRHSGPAGPPKLTPPTHLPRLRRACPLPREAAPCGWSVPMGRMRPRSITDSANRQQTS